jgi:hypothetical protein
MGVGCATLNIYACAYLHMVVDGALARLGGPCQPPLLRARRERRRSNMRRSPSRVSFRSSVRGGRCRGDGDEGRGGRGGWSRPGECPACPVRDLAERRAPRHGGPAWITFPALETAHHALNLDTGGANMGVEDLLLLTQRHIRTLRFVFVGVMQQCACSWRGVCAMMILICSSIQPPKSTQEELRDVCVWVAKGTLSERGMRGALTDDRGDEGTEELIPWVK